MIEDWSAFHGNWQVTRRVRDLKAAALYRFSGQMRIRPVTANEAEVQEQGVLSGPEGRFQAERRYLWRKEGDEIAVFHSDGSAFHRFSPQSGRLNVDHLCGADLYQGRYMLGRFPRWRLCWQVKGPRKDYRMLTCFQPLDVADEEARP